MDRLFFKNINSILIIFITLLPFFCIAQENQINIKELQDKISRFEKFKDVQNKEYAECLNNLAVIYYGQEKYDKAEPLFLRSLEVSKEILGENNEDYVGILMNLALFYQNQGKFKDAEPFYIKSIKIDKKIIGEKHPDYAIALNNLALLYREQGKYDEAEPLFINALEIRKEILGEKHHDYSTSLNNLARLYIDLGKYKEAEPLFLKTLEIRKEISGEKDEEYLITLNDLAVLYSEEAEYELSEQLYKKTIEICKEIYGLKHSNYASALNSLGILYELQGKYSKAEPLILESLAIRKGNSGEKGIDYSNSLASLGGLYLQQGKYDVAKPLYLKSLEINKEILGDKHPDYATSLNNLALLLKSQGKYDEALPLAVNSLEIRKEILGENHPDYANSLNSLANIYLGIDKYSEAEPLYIKALEIRKEILGINHPVYANSLNSLAFVYEKQGKNIEAEFLYLNVIEIFKQSFGENHPSYISSLNNLAELYRVMGLNEKASIYFKRYIKGNKNRIIDVVPSLTENELIAYINFNKEEFFSPLSFLYDFPTQYLSMNVRSFENELLLNNLSLRNQNRIKVSILKSSSQSLQDKYLQFIKNKSEIKKIQELPFDYQPANFGIITKETEQIEKELALMSNTFSDFKKEMTLSFNDFKNKLNKNEVVIDLVSFNYYNKAITDIIFYAAFMIKSDFKAPKLISLFEEKQLDFLLASNGETKQSDKFNKQYIDKSISDLFLNPLQKYLNGITTIYLSPSGLGHQINFAALPVSETEILGEKYNIHILSSPSKMVDYKVSILDKKSDIELLLYGGIDYNKSTPKVKLEYEKDVIDNTNEIVALRTRSGILGFDYIDGTNKEVNQIQLNGNQNGFTTTIYKESDATKKSLLQLDGRISPYVLHIATHGFFFEAPLQNEITNEFKGIEGKAKIYKASEDPMMRSGLVFAGANNYWNKTNEDTTNDNGILTASEISNLDLSACQLVVLSACETGLGEVKGSEGVFGLQRAFKMAGVKNIIMSLWKVPDTQTAELFDLFYGECFNGKTIHEAFQSAQSQMKVKYSPYYWAGFVLLE
jgi:tetratricopeptide (TPR) repeat protein/CHAT domain-containing protein